MEPALVQELFVSKQGVAGNGNFVKSSRCPRVAGIICARSERRFCRGVFSMNGLARGLLSGASLAALTMATLSAAEAAGLTISSAVSAVTVATAEDFIVVTGTGHVAGKVTNNGQVGLPGQPVAIHVAGGGIVGGEIFN